MASYEFNVAGVTMGNRQKTLRVLSNAVRSVCKTKDLHEYGNALSNLNVRLKWEKDNAHDAYAVLIQVWSGKRKKWIGLGYVPRKIQIGKDKTPLCVVVAKMVHRNMIQKVFIEYIGSFERIDKDGEEKIIYYCKVMITFKTG